MQCEGTGAMTERGLQIYEWEAQGYQPLVFHHDWMVAALNWEPPFDPGNLGEIERHNHTDEVFVLIRGKAVIFTVDERGMQVEEMSPGVLHNVRQGTWHGLVATREARWVIVESRDTHLNDCEFRRLGEAECAQVRANLPDWALQE